MLRIHIERAPGLVTVRLEGKLIYPWVDELVRVWAELSEGPPGDRATRIDLDAISYVDDRGNTLLTVLRNAGCELHGSAPFIASVIEEVTASSPSA